MEKLLRALARPGAFAEADGDGFVVRSHADRRRKPVARIASAEVTEALRCGRVRRLPDGRMIAAEGPAAQAFAAADTWQINSDGRNVKRRINTAESPMAWLMRHKDANGLSFLTRAHLAALEKLREDHAIGYAHSGLTSNWDGFGGGGRSGFRGDFFSGDGPHIFRLAARTRAQEALACLGAPLRAVFERVCLEGTALGVIERGFKLPRRTAKHHVREALDRLAKYYGY
jgi:hypothetical protein